MQYKFWCQACGVYVDSACEESGHRSEQLYLVGTAGAYTEQWRRYTPYRIFERLPDGGLMKVKS